MAKEAKENLYWIAAGVVSVEGKDYGINDVLPVDKIDKDKLARWKKEGKIGAKVAPVKANLGEKIKELETDLAEANEKIAELEKLLEAATADDGSGAGEK